MHEAVKRRLNLGKACNVSVQNTLTLVFCVLSKIGEIKMKELKFYLLICVGV
jgi:hypothetical protein